MFVCMYIHIHARLKSVCVADFSGSENIHSSQDESFRSTIVVQSFQTSRSLATQRDQNTRAYARTNSHTLQCTGANIYAYKHTYIYAFILLVVCTPVHAHTHVHTYAYTHTHIHTYTHTHLHTYTHTHLYNTQTHTHIHTHVHVHVHTNTCTHVGGRVSWMSIPILHDLSSKPIFWFGLYQ